MTVRELVAKLRQIPEDLPVQIKGCDCINPAADVEILRTLPTSKDEPESHCVLISMTPRAR